MAPARWLPFVALALAACCGNDKKRHDYERAEITAQCQLPGIKTDEASNRRCGTCCKEKGADAGTVWGYGTCKCFETRWEPKN